MGDVSMLQGTSILGSSRVTSDETEILHIPAAKLRRALAEIPAVSKTIVDALIMRRRRLRRDREFAGMRVLASRDARDGHQLDDFLDKNRIPHRLIEFESEQGQALSQRFHLTTRDLPVLITPAGARLRKPSLREVAREAGLLRSLAEEDETEVFCDLAIVGAGPKPACRSGVCRIRRIEDGLWKVMRPEDKPVPRHSSKTSLDSRPALAVVN
jgi:thioredoxin reductase (NADPH)